MLTAIQCTFYSFLVLLVMYVLSCYFVFQKYMPLRKTGEEMNFTYVECLLYTFHHLANKVRNVLLFCILPCSQISYYPGFERLS